MKTFALFGALFFFPIALTFATDRPIPKPNVIVILADDLGYSDLGCFGSKKIKTPNLDRMAKDGLRLTSFYAQPVCGPSRAALMTGCYPIRVGEPRNNKNQHTELHTKEVTIAEVLKQAGYATACIGKWHLGANPNGQGFDYFYGTPAYNGATVHVEDSSFRSKILRNSEVVIDAVQSWDHITQDYTREALEFIRANKERPFFLYLAHNMPHIPLGASENFKGKSAGGPFGDAVEEIDWSCGEVFKTLRDLGIDERTLVVFTSDNGPWIETTLGNNPQSKAVIPRDHSGNADPLRGHKMLTWDGGERVPCIMRWPGNIPADLASDELSTTMDLLPTFARFAGGEIPKDRTLDGKDIGPLLLNRPGAKSPHDVFYYYCYTHLQAVRDTRWKLVLPRPEHPEWTGWSGRFIGNKVSAVELYDLKNDIAEAKNVADQHPDEVAKLMHFIEAGRAELGDYDRIGAGQRFFDSGPKRQSEEKWISAVVRQ